MTTFDHIHVHLHDGRRPARDDWSPEARKAAAEARKRKGGGGIHKVATAHGFKPGARPGQYVHPTKGSIHNHPETNRGPNEWTHYGPKADVYGTSAKRLDEHLKRHYP